MKINSSLRNNEPEDEKSNRGTGERMISTVSNNEVENQHSIQMRMKIELVKELNQVFVKTKQKIKNLICRRLKEKKSSISNDDEEYQPSI